MMAVLVAAETDDPVFHRTGHGNPTAERTIAASFIIDCTLKF
jgi:hypothetical protein